MTKITPLLIVGAGPYGLALSAWMSEQKKDHIILGYNMDYWKNHMPKGMYLRSASDWHLDPAELHTIHRYLETKNIRPADAEPITLEFYLAYAEWFIAQKNISPRPAWINQLDRTNGHFSARLDDGQSIQAEKVILAVGLRYFKNIPDPYPAILPKQRFHHTAEFVDFSILNNKKVLIIGGRQSAFEWAALIHEHGAKEIHLTYRHDTPSFQHSDWTWVNPLLDSMVENPAWFRNLSQSEKDAVTKHLWSEGRLKLEPWLAQRIHRDSIYFHPHTHVVDSNELLNNEVKVVLSDDTTILIDHVILATGYKMDISHIPFITKGNMSNLLETNNGFPVLDETFQSNIPNLYFIGFPAAQDFGPFFGFTAAVKTSAKIIGRAIKQ